MEIKSIHVTNLIQINKFMGLINQFKNNLLNIKRKRYDKKSKKKILELIPDLEDFINKSKSTGAHYSDYFQLFDYVTRNKPKYILECGGGITTFVIAKALEKISYKSSMNHLIISMEELIEYHEEIKQIFPPELKKFVNFIHSPRIEKKHMFYCGVGYKDIPRYDYEFVFVDGPDNFSPVDKIRKFNFDLITAIQISSKPIDAFIDTRLATCYCYQNIFGKNKVNYDVVKKLGIVKNVSKNDLVKNWGKKNFKHNHGNLTFDNGN